MRTTSVSAGARPRLHNSDGRPRHQRKRRREDILDDNKETLISAVESNLGPSVLAEKFACDEKTGVDFLEQNFAGSPCNLGPSVLAEKFACDEKT